MTAIMKALDASQAIIEFTPSGHIVFANTLFLQSMGYHLDEIIGKHHNIFVDSKEKESQDYQHFWRDLSAGKTKQQ